MRIAFSSNLAWLGAPAKLSPILCFCHPTWSQSQRFIYKYLVSSGLPSSNDPGLPMDLYWDYYNTGCLKIDGTH